MRTELGWAQRLLGAVGASLIRVYLRLFGRTVRRDEVPWLSGPIGRRGRIGDDFYDWLAQTEGLTKHINRSGSGLLPSVRVLAGESFDPSRADTAVLHFYENTSEYDLDVWSETRFPARLCLWLLVSTVSRYMNQLNFPVHGLEMSRGMTSDIVELCDDASDTRYRGWFRKVKATDQVIYTGFYMTERPPGHGSPCVKVVFPLPSGKAVVLLRPGLDDHGRFTLMSSGKEFGDPGFYRILDLGDGRLKVRYLRSLKEFFEVYRDDDGVLRCDHRVEFLGMTMLRLHYRMRPKTISLFPTKPPSVLFA